MHRAGHRDTHDWRRSGRHGRSRDRLDRGHNHAGDIDGGDIETSAPSTKVDRSAGVRPQQPAEQEPGVSANCGEDGRGRSPHTASALAGGLEAPSQREEFHPARKPSSGDRRCAVRWRPPPPEKPRISSPSGDRQCQAIEKHRAPRLLMRSTMTFRMPP